MPKTVSVVKKKKSPAPVVVEDHLSDSLEDDVAVDGVLSSPEESVLQDEIEKYSSKLSVDECQEALAGADSAELLMIIGSSVEFQSFLKEHHPETLTRIGRQLKSPKFWASMVPGVNMVVMGKNIRHAYRKKKAGKGMHGMDDTLDGMMDVSQSHQKQKLVSESVKMGVSVTATALGPLGATVGAAVTPLMGVGGMTATAIGGGINTGVSSGVSLASTAAAHELASDDLSHVEDEVGDGLEDGSMQDYKTNRALLHFLGYGPRTTPEEMAVHGVEPEQEAARLMLKERMGFDPESDLVGRDQETRSRGKFLPKKHDWLTKTERGWYDKLKSGKVTIGEIPIEFRLAMAWKLEKVFDVDGALTEQAIKAIQGMPDPPTGAPVPKPDMVPKLGSMDLEDLKKWYQLEMLPSAPGGTVDDSLDLVSSSKVLALKASLPDVPTHKVELDFETRLARLRSGVSGPTGDSLVARLKALTEGDDHVPDPELEEMELRARLDALTSDMDIDRTRLDEMELEVRLARLSGDLVEDDGLAKASQMLVLLQKLPDAPKQSLEELLSTI